MMDKKSKKLSAKKVKTKTSTTYDCCWYDLCCSDYPSCCQAAINSRRDHRTGASPGTNQ